MFSVDWCRSGLPARSGRGGQLEQASDGDPDALCKQLEQEPWTASGGAGYVAAMAPAVEAAVEAYYTVEDVAQHSSKADCWVIVHDGACAPFGRTVQ